MIIARQSTARIVTVGPVLDADGVAVTDSVVGDFKISKNGGAPAALNGSATLTHRHTGHYSLSLTTSDLDTVGSAEITCDDTVNACPVKEITVVEEAVYDAQWAASAVGYVASQALTSLTVNSKSIESLYDANVAASGTADSGTTTTMVDSALTQADDYWNGAWIVFTSGTLQGKAAIVTDFVAGTDTVTFSPAMPTAVTSSHTYLLLPVAPGSSAADIADAIWDEALAGHATAGTAGALLGGFNATAITNFNTVFNTDFASNYNSTSNKWSAEITGDVVLDSLTVIAVQFNSLSIVTDFTIAEDFTVSGNLTATAFVGNVTGNLSGSVGSVTGAVGSVTGNVGGNVTGSVGSLTATAQGNVRTAVGLASANLDTQIGTLATAANLATVAGYLDTEIAAILADTNELQTDWADGGRLDLILDARASQTSVDDLPTNAELATALGTADDPTLAAIAALSIPSANTIADAVLSRSVTNVQDTADAHSLCTIILATLESSISSTTWTIRKTGGTTFATKTLTVDAAADPITGVT